MEARLRTVTFSIASREDVTRRVLAAFKDKKRGDHICFASIELLWKVLSPKRWEILKAMTGQGPMPFVRLREGLAET